MKALNLIGSRFGKLTVIERVENDAHGHSRWRCKCDCGNDTVVIGYELKNGHIKSCGCYRSENLNDFNRTHNLSKHPLYRVWKAMRNRCNNPNNTAYERYGGRGIKVCDDWNSDFKPFYEWAVSNGYEKGLTIDRIDNDGNYCPENCRWVSYATQNTNKRNIRMITFNGKTQNMKEWANELGIPYKMFAKHIKDGQSISAVQALAKRVAELEKQVNQ